jgi:hypothetical protein
MGHKWPKSSNGIREYNFIGAVSIDVNANLSIVIYQYKTGILMWKGLKKSSRINFFICQTQFLAKIDPLK